MSRLRNAIYRYWRTGMMYVYTLLAPCQTGQCTYVELTLVGTMILIGIVFRRRWATLLTLGVLCLALTYSRAWLGPLIDFTPTLGPCGFDVCTP